MPAEHDPVETAIRRFCRALHSADLLADGDAYRVCWIIDGLSGALAMPADRGIAEADQLVLLLPDESAPTLQLLLSVEVRTSPEAAGALADRYEAYHGRHRLPLWLSMRPTAARWHESVWEGEDLDLRNSLHAHEQAMLRELNSRTGDLAGLAAAIPGSGSAAAAEPARAIGFDQDGIDLRRSGGPVRFEFERPAVDRDDALTLLERGLQAGR